MTRIQIETITEAMVKKQTWLRKGLEDFLKVWAETTKTDIHGHYKLVLKSYDDENEIPTRLILVRGYSEIDGDSYNEYTGKWERWPDSYWNRETKSNQQIKEIINLISSKINDYFRNIQNDIDSLSAAGQEIARITQALQS